LSTKRSTLQLWQHAQQRRSPRRTGSRRLRDAAFALAHEQTSRPLTVGDIVARAGVSRQVFYQHFRDRDDAVAYAFSVAFASATADIDARPRARILALFDFAAEHRAMYRNIVPSAVTQRVVPPSAQNSRRHASRSPRGHAAVAPSRA
jgi:AcrR family transcriptional regulator